MTYCVGMSLEQGLLFASDSRTNAGVDHISTFSKMAVFENTGDRAIVLLSAGNLGTSQAVIGALRKQITSDGVNLMNVPSMFDVAELVGSQTRRLVHYYSTADQHQSMVDFSCSFLVGGQIRGETPRLFQIYAQGNFIEASADTCYLQIGESKYGKPILDRVISTETSVDEALKCALVSFDSTIRSNLSVGLPIDLSIIPRDSYQIGFRHRISHDDAYFQSLRDGWSQGLKRVFNELPMPQWFDYC